MSTWNDLKLATLQKMFSADDIVVIDESTKGYLDAMPYCANEGLALLATAGKFITKSITISQKDIKNLIADTLSKPITQFDDTHSFESSEGRSYYFECAGIGTCEIYVDDVLLDTINIDSNGYEAYSGLISNSDKKTVKLIFNTLYPMVVKNVAIYAETFPVDSEGKAYVAPFTDKVKYDLKELAPDFYQIDPQGIYYEGAYQTYLQTSEFYQEGTHQLILDRDMFGSFTVYYRAYPEQITPDTDDEYELPIDPEVFVLLPLYMASQLYKDDDNGIATSYRNEFEVGFDRLRNSANLSAYEEFTSESGWV